MDDLANYEKAQAEREAASALYEYAGVALELTGIRARLAEIKSQHEPLAGLLSLPISERDRMYAAAFFVVVGRMPENVWQVDDMKGA